MLAAAADAEYHNDEPARKKLEEALGEDKPPPKQLIPQNYYASAPIKH